MRTEDLVVGKMYYIKRLNFDLHFFTSQFEGCPAIYNFKRENKEEIFLFLGLGGITDFGSTMLRFSTKDRIDYFFSLDPVAKPKLEKILSPIESYEKQEK